MRFAVAVPEPRVTATAEGLARLDLDGYTLDGTPGGAPGWVRVFWVAVPPTGEVAVSGAASEWRAAAAAPLASVPLRIERGAPAVERFQPADAAAFAARPVVRLLDVTWLRNQRVARIAVEPVRADRASGGLEVARRVDVEVRVGDGAASTRPAEAADGFEDLYRGLLVNYEQGRAWRRPAAASAPIGARPAEVALAGGLDTTNVFAGRRWVRIGIDTSGFYSVTYAQLRQLELFGGVENLPLDSLRVFTWPGVPVLPERDYCDGCGYREVAIAFVDRSNDGRFAENEDYFYFYALGPNGWRNVYDPAQPDTVYLNHPYETRNYYYVTLGDVDGTPPKRIAVTPAPADPDGSEIAPVTFRERLHFEVDADYFPDATPYYPDELNPNTYFWEKWFWRTLDVGRTFAEPFDAPGADPSRPARIRSRLWGLASRDTCQSTPIGSEHHADFVWPGAGARHVWSALRGYTIDTTVPSVAPTDNTFRVDVATLVDCGTRTDRVGVAWFDVFYDRFFAPVNDELAFESPAAPGRYLFRVGPFTSAVPPRVFDVTDPLAVAELIQFDWEPGGAGHELAFEVTQTGLRRYRIIRDASIRRVSPGAIVDAPATSLSNLRSTSLRADYLVIYYDGFRSAADLLAQWRRDYDGLEALTVPISAIYDQFSGGRTDPGAVRNFLRAARFSPWDRVPTFVTLLGDASFDFKNLTGRAPSGRPGTLLPSFENSWDHVVLRQFATDDWMLNVDDATRVVPDFTGGRIPANDAATAIDVVRNKIMFYDQSSPTGEWRNRVMFIADDHEQGAAPDQLGWTHLDQTAVLDSASTPAHFDRKYVYLHTYPDEGDTKPAAKADIKQSIDRGVVMFNYIGHGSPFKLSDESVFLDTDVGTLANPTRFPVFVAASCDIGKYNDPTVQSLGELLVVSPGRGAIGVISATELALSGQNANLNNLLYRRLFTRDANGQYGVPVAQALKEAKLGGINSQKYQWMGDAATRPKLPRYHVDVALYDSSGTVPLTQLERGRTVVVRGRVLDREVGGVPVALDGVAGLLVEDSAPREVAPPCNWCNDRPVPYWYTAGPVFRGDVGLQGGEFQGRFVVPLEARTGARARVRAYVAEVEGAGDGVGSRRVQLVAGSAASDDASGPAINLSFTTGATTVRPDATLRIVLSDPSGILITGHTPQNGIIVTIDGNTTNRRDVTASFRYAADSHQAGTALFQLPNLAPGPHRIEVSAADNLAAGLGAGAHRSTASIDFEVVDQPPLSVARAYLFPNPVYSGGPGSGGTFVVDAPGDSVNVLVTLYTVSGRLIRKLKAFGGLGQVQLVWDGLDAEGAEMANGVYLFRVHVNARAEDGTSSAHQQADAEGRFVIVNR